MNSQPYDTILLKKGHILQDISSYYSSLVSLYIQESDNLISNSDCTLTLSYYYSQSDDIKLILPF